MSSVGDQLKPALQLASQLISHERTLQWFTHVSHSRYVRQEKGPSVLVGNSEFISKPMLNMIKQELLVVSRIVKFGWLGNSKTMDGVSIDGISIPCLRDLARLLAGSNAAFEPEHEIWFPSILISVSMLHAALQHKHRGGTPVAQRTFQFLLARLLVHKLAHVWVAYCHGFKAVEPLVYPGECLPECGFSFEIFVFGAILRTSLDNDNDETILATTLA
jgi:hypothetical protein